MHIQTSSNVDWETVRDSVEMNPSYIYLNTGTAGLVSKAIHRLALEYRTRLHHNPTDFAWRCMWEELWESRAKLAIHMGCTPDRLIFFQNISQAINTFCMSVNLPNSAEILMTDHEYGSMTWAWERAAQRFGWTIKIAKMPLDPESPQEIVDTIHRALTPRTKLLYISHILYTNGMVLPLADVCGLARTQGVMTCIDGAHAAGMLPLQLDSLGADFYASNLHKWFMAPVGAAFLYVKQGFEQHLQPLQVSWAHRDDRSVPNMRNEFGSTPWIRQFEMEGTRDTTPWFLIRHCCEFLESVGYENIRSKHRLLSDSVRELVDGIGGLKLCTPNHGELRGGLTAFLVPKTVDAQALRKRLWAEYRIETNAIDWSDRQFFRVSTHIYNTLNEVERLEAALKELMV
jgi:isopenicillin-N epimerase